MPHPIFSFRLDPELIARLDKYAAQLKAETGLPVSRNAALAKIVAEHLGTPDRKPRSASRAARR